MICKEPNLYNQKDQLHHPDSHDQNSESYNKHLAERIGVIEWWVANLRMDPDTFYGLIRR